MGRDLILSTIKKDHIQNLANDGKRHDGRNFMDFRNLQVTPNVIGKAEGSADVRLGNTRVIAGIKMIQGSPYPDTPNKGAMSTGAELNPLAAPEFEAGPPREAAIELSRVVDRGIRESGLIDMEALCIVPGEKIWMAFIDMDILDHDGNLFDACSIAATAALMNTTVPFSRIDPDREDAPLPLSEALPVQTTFAKVGNAIMVDPDLDEEACMDVRLTVATDQYGNIRAMQKGGGSGAFTSEEVLETVAHARDVQAVIRDVLEKSRL